MTEGSRFYNVHFIRANAWAGDNPQRRSKVDANAFPMLISRDNQPTMAGTALRHPLLASEFVLEAAVSYGKHLLHLKDTEI